MTLEDIEKVWTVLGGKEAELTDQKGHIFVWLTLEPIYKDKLIAALLKDQKVDIPLEELKTIAIKFIKTKGKHTSEIWGSERSIYTTCVKEFLEYVKREVSCQENKT